MDTKAFGGTDWLGLQWRRLKEQDQAGPVLTAVVVVLLTYMLYNVSYPCANSMFMTDNQ